jgi:hypothetical protein
VPVPRAPRGPAGQSRRLAGVSPRQTRQHVEERPEQRDGGLRVGLGGDRRDVQSRTQQVQAVGVERPGKPVDALDGRPWAGPRCVRERDERVPANDVVSVGQRPSEGGRDRRLDCGGGVGTDAERQGTAPANGDVVGLQTPGDSLGGSRERPLLGERGEHFSDDVGVPG